MTVIASYADLQAQAIAWSHRADLASSMPGFIEIAEREMFRELTLRSIEMSVSGTTSGDAIAFPADADSIERIKLEYAGNSSSLSYTSPNGLESLAAASGRPSRFTVEDGVIRLLAAPAGPYSYTIYYMPKLIGLSDSYPSNWLLANHSDLYLKAVLLQVAKFVEKMEDVARLIQEVAAGIDSVSRADERKRFPVSGGLQIKPRSYR